MDIEKVNSIIARLLNESNEYDIDEIKGLLNELTASEVAHLLESAPPKKRKELFSLIDTKDEGDVLFEVGEEIQQDLVSNISNEELSAAVEPLELDEKVDILQNLPEDRMLKVLSKMSLMDRNRVEESLIYPDDTAGGLLNNDVISVRPENTLEVVLRYLRSHGELPENTDKIFVVSKQNLYLGELSISKLITSEPSLTVEEVMDQSVDPIIFNQEDKEVARIFERENLVSIAVLNAEDTFAPPGRAAKSRVFWLSMNLLTAFIAAFTINIFQDTLDKIVYLAVLMPIVASMGGVAATQTLTIVIRGLTLDQINTSNMSWLFKRELAVSIINGIVLAILVGSATYLWFGDIKLGVLISGALIINLISSVIAGIFVPLFLRKMKQDPAIAGSVVVTTVTDVIGFFSFLGLATLFLI
jgi:magnesium transporter